MRMREAGSAVCKAVRTDTHSVFTEPRSCKEMRVLGSGPAQYGLDWTLHPEPLAPYYPRRDRYETITCTITRVTRLRVYILYGGRVELAPPELPRHAAVQIVLLIELLLI